MNHLTKDNGSDCNSPYHNPATCEQCEERKQYDSVTYCQQCFGYYCHEKKEFVETPKYGVSTAEICEECENNNDKNMKQRPIKYKAWVKQYDPARDRNLWQMIDADRLAFSEYDLLFNQLNSKNQILLEYTPFFDIDQKQICEGDILECINRIQNCIFVVEYDMRGFIIDNRIAYEFINNNKVKIIGNKFENKNLLK